MLRTIVKKNEYRDSIFLMRASKKLQELRGIKQSIIIMATDTNKALLKDLGLLTDNAKVATPNDMVIVIKAVDEEALKGAITELNYIFQEKPPETGEAIYRTLEVALDAMPDANLVLISVPGEFAAREARKALKKNLNVLMFSDNVPIQEELELKREAEEKGLLMMGADCGVAVINNVALALSSIVQPGPIGVVGATGSGIQEVTVLVEREGLGISQAIGVGGRDLSDMVGGIGMLQGIKALENNEKTSVIVLVSKPPSPKTMNKILEAVGKCKKPVVVNFLGADPEPISKAGVFPAFTLEDAALKAVALTKKQPFREEQFTLSKTEIDLIITNELACFHPEQRYLRGLFCGGTFCEEAMLILKDVIGDVYSNVSLRRDLRLKDSEISYKHSIIDMGAEEFTKGRPHPVIDPEIRNQRFLKETQDPKVAVILLDFILGPAAHPDPVGAIVDTIAQAKMHAHQNSRYLSVVASVCGSREDPQNLSLQERKLREVDVIVMPSNAQASRLAGLIVSRKNLKN